MTKTLQLPIWAGTAFMKRIRSCFSLYDNPLAYRAFGYRNGISDKIISEIIRKKTYDVFEATIDVYSYTHLEQTDEKALIDRKDARFIKAFLRNA